LQPCWAGQARKWMLDTAGVMMRWSSALGCGCHPNSGLIFIHPVQYARPRKEEQGLVPTRVSSLCIIKLGRKRKGPHSRSCPSDGSEHNARSVFFPVFSPSLFLVSPHQKVMCCPRQQHPPTTTIHHPSTAKESTPMQRRLLLYPLPS
jgi:hypothetical protein